MNETNYIPFRLAVLVGLHSRHYHNRISTNNINDCSALFMCPGKQ